MSVRHYFFDMGNDSLLAFDRRGEPAGNAHRHQRQQRAPSL
jgi:hypothetical protein